VRLRRGAAIRVIPAMRVALFEARNGGESCEASPGACYEPTHHGNPHAAFGLHYRKKMAPADGVGCGESRSPRFALRAAIAARDLLPWMRCLVTPRRARPRAELEAH
jgi:hypothetical protein